MLRPKAGFCETRFLMGGKMPKYTVYLMTPYETWEEVEAATKEEAVNKCGFDPEYPEDLPHRWVVEEEDDVEEDAEDKEPEDKEPEDGEPEELLLNCKECKWDL